MDKKEIRAEFAERLHSAVSNRGCECIHDVINDVMENLNSDDENDEEETQLTTVTWLIYSEKIPLTESTDYDFSNDTDGIRLISLYNTDRTGIPGCSIAVITRESVEDCFSEFDGQLSDGIWENEVKNPRYVMLGINQH